MTAIGMSHPPRVHRRVGGQRTALTAGIGAAPRTLPAHELATALNLMNERTLFASFAGEQPSVPEARVLDTLVHIWVTSIYGENR